MISVPLRPIVARVLRDCERMLKPTSRASVRLSGYELEQGLRLMNLIDH
jgi:hypothetical protein